MNYNETICYACIQIETKYASISKIVSGGYYISYNYFNIKRLLQRTGSIS